jgi:predicted RNase H-like HicB family nuclease
MTAKYHINLFWSEPDGAWVADVPDLQSCSAFGDSPAQASLVRCCRIDSGMFL